MTPSLRRVAWHRAASVLAISLIATACSGSDSESTDPTTPADQTAGATTVAASPDATGPTATTTEPPATTTEPTPETTAMPETTTTTTTTTLAPRGASPDDPAPVGDTAFDLIGYDGGDAVADLHVFGLVELPVDEDETDPGSCLGIVGIVTLVESEAPVAGTSALPRADLLAGEEALYGGISECDRTTLDAAGFGEPFDAVLVPGTQYAFGTAVFVPEGVSPSVIAAGTAGGSGRFYEPTVLAGFPPLPELAVGATPADLRSLADPASASIHVQGALLDSHSSFDVSVIGVAMTAAREDRDVVGDCVTVLSTVRGVESHGAIINALAIPDVHILVGGLLYDQEIGLCDTDDIEAAGYGSNTRAGVAPGNTYAVETSFVVPTGAVPSAIFVGEPTRVGESWGFEATVLDAVPPAPERERLNPELELAAAGTVPTYRIEKSDAVWTGTIHGLVELAHNAQAARCYAIVGTMAREGGESFPPSLGLIADGALSGSGFGFARCTTDALEAAGYIDDHEAAAAIDADGAVEVGFYETIFLAPDHGPIAGIVIGNAASADEVVYVDPVLLTAIPPAP